MPGNETFRDHVSTVDKDGRRIWIFPKKPRGAFYDYRKLFSYFQILILFIVPFITIQGEPLILLDIINRKFVLLTVTFWPQDFLILGLIILFSCVLIFLFTSMYGRVWCGWLCPQTLFLEMIFRRIDYFILGDSVKQKRIANQNWDKKKVSLFVLRHGLYFIISVLIANIFLAYIIGRDELLKIITDPIEEHLFGFSAMLVFSFIFYWLYIYFREQFCSFLCPYARLQSVLLDKNSIGVIYDFMRGEPRGKAAQGDCIDCNLCHNVCPTGIDIRNGSPQLECIQCTACIDACDHVMKKRNLPTGLIRYASQNMIEKGTKFHFSARIISYSLICFVLLGAISYTLMTRSNIENTIIRQRGSVPILQNDSISNLYNAKVLNKSTKAISYEIKYNGPGEIIFPGGAKTIESHNHMTINFFIKIPQSKIHQNSLDISLDIIVDGEKHHTIQTSFLGL